MTATIGTAFERTSALPCPLVTDGKCLTGTLQLLAAAGSLSPEATASVRSQAEALLSDVLQAYENGVARGEVGAGGTHLASEAAPLAGACPTGLLYGRVQSGKTAAMVVSSALAFDNGFRVIVVFTSNYLDLVKQTAKRLEIVEGPIVRSSVSLDVLEKDAARIEQAISTHGLLIVCAKDPNHILSLVDFLRKVRADRYPALIFDDEADQATPDTTANARSSGRKSPPLHSSTINRRIVRNNARDELENQSARSCGTTFLCR